MTKIYSQMQQRIDRWWLDGDWDEAGQLHKQTELLKQFKSLIGFHEAQFVKIQIFHVKIGVRLRIGHEDMRLYQDPIIRQIPTSAIILGKSICSS